MTIYSKDQLSPQDAADAYIREWPKLNAEKEAAMDRETPKQLDGQGSH